MTVNANKKEEIKRYGKTFASSSLRAVVRRTAAENAAMMIAEKKVQNEIDLLFQYWDAGVRSAGVDDHEIKKTRDYLASLVLLMFT